MAVSKVLSIVLLGLFAAALANPAPEAPTTPAGTGTTPAGTGINLAEVSGVQDYLTDADKDKVCKVPASGPALCAAAGPADDFCSKLAASVSGTAPCCAAPNVCSFKVGGNATSGAGTPLAGNGNPPAGTGTTSAGTSTTSAGTSTTPAGTGTTPAGTGTTSAGTGTTPAGTGTTSAGTGTTSAGTGTPAPAGPVVVPAPNTAYVSCNVTPAGFKPLKTCPTSKTIFVFPSAPGSDLLAGTGSTTPGTTTTEE